MVNLLAQTKEKDVRNELSWLDQDCQRLGIIEKLGEP